MPCYSPLQCWRGSVNKETGKRSIVFRRPKSSPLALSELSVPCGQCIGCRLERSRQWAVRCMHEASLHKRNCFITLTYSSDNLPKDGSLDKSHFTLFMKRMRKEFGEGIRYFHCGEYGDNFGRPHYHACLFNMDFDDKVRIEDTASGFPQYTSATLDRLWNMGRCTIGDVTFESAAYVARYVMKKVTGTAALVHYADVDLSTGEVLGYRIPEYITMSRGSKKLKTGGIGKGWIDKYFSDVYPSDEIIVRKVRTRPTKFYDNFLEYRNPVLFDAIKSKRKASSVYLVSLLDRLNGKSAFLKNADPRKLRDREFIKKSRIKLLKRTLEVSNDS